MNYYKCAYDQGQCCLPGVICKDQNLFYVSAFRMEYMKEFPKYCKCAASAPEGEKPLTFRDGDFGPPIWSDNSSK